MQRKKSAAEKGHILFHRQRFVIMLKQPVISDDRVD